MDNRGISNSDTAATEAQRTLRAFSHDMRTPIENVIALATMSLDRLNEDAAGGTDAVTLYLRKILAAVRDMEMMTDDLLCDDEPQARQVRFTAQDIAQSVAAAVGERAARKHQMLRIDVSGLGAQAMVGDYAALMRILTNLMSNAVKYTPEGGRISLSARAAMEGSAGMAAEFVVEDDGTGMDAAFMARMYEPFARAEQARADAIPGHGLGLTIVRRMTQRMNGTLDAQSAPGKGTRFTLRAVLRVESRAAEGVLAGKRILLAEDNDLCAEIARAILEAKGASVRRAANGEEAVQAFCGGTVGAFDAILMDMHMPTMDGCTAARRIRALTHTDAACIPILALTAGGDAQDEERARDAGMNGCLKKPLDVDVLCAALARG